MAALALTKIGAGALNPLKPNIHFIGKPPRFPLNFRFCGGDSGGNLTFPVVYCKLKISIDDGKGKGKKKGMASGIVVPRKGAPSLKEEEDGGSAGNGDVPAKSPGKKTGGFGLLKRFSRRVLSTLSYLPLAISEMFAIAFLMALGTFIEQGEAPDFYFQKYPEDNPTLGFFTWRWILTLGFDHMFSSPIFLSALALLGASLMACTYTTQIPMAKVARRWSFPRSVEAIRKQEFTDTLPRASIRDVGVVLMGDGYEVFSKGPSLYAFKGMAGRFAPIGVHLALILIMGGGTFSATGSFKGSVTVPQGLNFVVGDVLGPTGFLSFPTEAFNTEVHINRFFMDYYESGEVSQFHTDISLFDLNGKEVMRKTISVNDPLRYEGITIYQTDWSISALQVLKNGEGPFNLPMAPLQINGDKKLYGTFLPVGDTDSSSVKGISMLARDLQSIVLYDQEGKFAGVRRPNSKLPIDIDGTKIDIVDAIGSSGLDLKTDPAVPIVYAGFGALMLTTCISYLSHSQIWALQDGTTVVIGGKTNRAKGEFPDEMNRLLDRVPATQSLSPSPLSLSETLSNQNQICKNSRSRESKMMHMTFYWGRKATILFDFWKTDSWADYSLSLFVCLLFAVFYQYMEDRRLRLKLLSLKSSKSSSPGAVGINSPLLYPRFVTDRGRFSVARAAGAVLFGVNSAIGYLLMLAVMSFNAGVFVAVVVGLAVGYLMFRSADEDVIAVENPCACA